MDNHRPPALALALLASSLVGGCAAPDTGSSTDSLERGATIICYEEGRCDPQEDEFCNYHRFVLRGHPFGRCEAVSCEDGKQNCDGIGGCECEAGCGDDGACLDVECDATEANACGDETQWCYTAHSMGAPGCQTCSDVVRPEGADTASSPSVAVWGQDGYPDYLNCDGIDGCEYECPRGYGPCTCPTPVDPTPGED